MRLENFYFTNSLRAFLLLKNFSISTAKNTIEDTARVIPSFQQALMLPNQEKVTNTTGKSNIPPYPPAESVFDYPIAGVAAPAKKFTLKCQNDNDTFSLKYADVLV